MRGILDGSGNVIRASLSVEYLQCLIEAIVRVHPMCVMGVLWVTTIVLLNSNVRCGVHERFRLHQLHFDRETEFSMLEPVIVRLVWVSINIIIATENIAVLAILPHSGIGVVTIW